MKHFFFGFFTAVILLNGINSTLNTTLKVAKDFTQYIQQKQ